MCSASPLGVGKATINRLECMRVADESGATNTQDTISLLVRGWVTRRNGQLLGISNSSYQIPQNACRVV